MWSIITYLYLYIRTHGYLESGNTLCVTMYLPTTAAKILKLSKKELKKTRFQAFMKDLVALQSILPHYQCMLSTVSWMRIAIPSGFIVLVN